ncbi:MAG: glycosyltransferase family 4 protein [Sulfuricurvum sp.]|nr:glycosyltransferase family 4 protein [Sulfuricurvum sp.]
MKILFCVRYDFFTKPGGDTIQTKAYIDELIKLNCIVDITTDFDSFELNYDVYHLINLDRPLETFIQIKYILDNTKKPYIVVSTIHHDMKQLLKINKSLQSKFIRVIYKVIPNINFIELLKNIIRIAKYSTTINKKVKYLMYQSVSYSDQQRFILSKVNKVLLLSDYELDVINRDLKINIELKKCVIVPNGINTELFAPEPDYKLKKDVLCVARIEPRKNQMHLLEIAKNLPFNITFIGKINQNNLSYYNDFISKVNELQNVTFLNGLPYEQLIDKMRSSRLNILPSYVEVSPLVDLEALACGMNVITTQYSSTNNMFDSDSILYIDPDKLNANTIKQMYNQNFDHELRLTILREFSWEKAAKKLKKVYEDLVNA